MHYPENVDPGGAEGVGFVGCDPDLQALAKMPWRAGAMTKTDSRKKRIEKKLKTGELPVKTQKEIEGYEKDIKKFEDDYRKAYDTKITRELTKPEQLSLTGFPTDLCRSTIFFPLPRRDRKKLQAEPVKIPFKTSWSHGEYEGRKLSVDDEDLLLVCLYLARKHKSSVFVTTYPEIQKLLRLNPNPYHNKQIKESFQRFGKASFTVNYKGPSDMWSVDHILKARGYKRKIKVTIGEDFYSEFLRNYTLMSLPFRLKIKGSIAKLLFTFLSSHSRPATYTSDTLIEVLNMNLKLDKKHLRSQLKRAFNELERQGFLTYTFDKERDLFTLETIPKRERKRLK